LPLLRPRYPVSPERVYLLLTGFYAFTYSIVVTVALVYQTQEARLNPFQLVLSGAALQAATFLLEVPTGVFADLKGRRISVITGMALLGLAFELMGSSTSFWVILTAQLIVGAALTFISGAQEAWISDEVGVANAGRIYLRSAQTVQYARLFGIPAGVALGTISLRLPLLLGGLMFALLAAFLIAVMPEDGFAGGTQREDGTLPGFRRTLTDGFGLVMRSPILVTLFGVAAFYELSGEVFIRLSVAHFLDNVGLPTIGSFQPVVWFGMMRMASALAGLGAVQYLRRTVEVTDRARVASWLLRINALQVVCLLTFALANSFLLAFAAYLVATSLSRMFQPLYLGLLNSHSESSVRATVISMSSQVDALAQSVGSPLLGVVASLVSIRAALAGAALALLPALGFNARVAEQQGRQPGLSAASN
jgi:DHA3 family tetracycline resistance protein-like MFS transporter